MTDEKLSELLMSSPQEGLAAAVGQYSGYVYKIVLTRLGDVCSREDMEEAVSDIFMKLYTAARKGTKISSVGGFLSCAAQRHCIDLFRKQGRRVQQEPLEEAEGRLSGEDIFTDSASELLEAVKQLGEPDTQIFIRKYYFGQRNKDIAAELGMNTSALNKRVSRGLLRLKKILEEGEQ